MNKRKLRRVAIVALVLVLLCNTLGVQASTKKDDPTVIVKDYGSLYTAIAEAKDNDVIWKQSQITYTDGLKAGDMVLVQKLNDNNKYVIIARVVEA